MNYDFFINSNPYTSDSIALRTVYVLNADCSYDVSKSGVSNKDLVVLRTFGGSGTIKIAGLDEINVLPGTILFFEHSKIRRYYCSSEKWDFWWFEFASNGNLGLPLNELLAIEMLADEVENSNACLSLLQKNTAASSRIASAVLSLMLSKWMMYIENTKNYNPHRRTIEKICEFLNSKLEENISVSEMAGMAGLCERRFRQVFESITGFPPKKYSEMLKLQAAQGLLKNTPLTLNEISLELGYSTQFHFSKAFKKEYGVSPSQYRMKI